MANPDSIIINLDIKNNEELKQVASKAFVMLLKDTDFNNAQAVGAYQASDDGNQFSTLMINYRPLIPQSLKDAKRVQKAL